MQASRWWRNLLGSVAIVAAAPVTAAEFADPEWPCVARKVPELALGQMWAGPVPEGAAASPDDIAALSRRIAQRRVTVEEAAATAADFIDGLEGDARASELARLFEAVLDRLNRDRGAVIAGIGRYAVRQAGLAEKVEREQLDLTSLEASEGADAARVEELRATLAWDTRIFRERAQSLTYVCETPVLIERRAFELARALGDLI